MIVYDQYVYTEKPDTDDDIVVFHSGLCSTIPNYSYGKDIRDYYLIHYCTGGQGEYSVGGSRYKINQHDGFLIMPDQSIVHTADAIDPWDLCWVAFFGRKAEKYLNMAGLGSSQLLFRYDKDDFLVDCIKNIYNESRGNKNVLAIQGYFLLFLGCLAECNSAKKQEQNEPFSHFQDAVNYIVRNIRSYISVEELASYLRLDVSQVYRIFKKNTEVSPQQYITRLRIDKAQELLTKTDLPVKDVAKWLGFEYQSHFAKQFKSTAGVSPCVYRKMSKK